MRDMMISSSSSRWGRRLYQQQQQRRREGGVWAWRWRDRNGMNMMMKMKRRLGISFTSRRLFRLLLLGLAFFAILPPLFFHFNLKRFHHMQSRKCSWMHKPPLVCAHGGDSSQAFPNTMAAYHIALQSQVDCIEIDVSRSLDGFLFALHDRDLQRISGNTTSRVGHLRMKEIEKLDAIHQLPVDSHNLKIPTVEDALKLVSSSVRQIILDAKIGPPLHEKWLAKDILSVIEKTECRNCLVWAKSDNIARDVIKLSSDVKVGYIVMMDPSTGTRSNLLRIRGAGVVGVYHPLIDEKLVKILHGRNKKVYAWTVDDENSMKRMLYEHVDAIITSDPTLLQRLMQEMRTECREEGFSS